MPLSIRVHVLKPCVGVFYERHFWTRAWSLKHIAEQKETSIHSFIIALPSCLLLHMLM
jgi:hypothetical protein